MSKQSNTSQVTTLDDGKKPESAASKAAVGAVAKVDGKNHDADLSGKRKLITIFKDATEGGSDAVFLSINGYAFQIPRGKPFNVPAEVVSVLRDAKTEHMVMGQHGVEVTEVPRYNFSVEDVPEAEAVAA
ncbi:hypothetical protein [Piscinibacter gummiphilus]|uniref:Uncharacterized protein n=1 Tax=Piscinibacter gummiphilus TaxID=946333 RepID=A0ABZ0CNC8_9BURK|nr:hypothetical protein [Piscinibacter gummiphilus]WOB06470.1 hypothetical protein RXV79_16230 [Piscinibacter gummiphilus]